jgi:hypothetical protein
MAALASWYRYRWWLPFSTTHFSEFSFHDDTAYLSKRSSTERLAPAYKNIFENAFSVIGGWDSAECGGHEIYNWAISEPAILPVFLTVNLTCNINIILSCAWF